jgi:hypothetical protein
MKVKCKPVWGLPRANERDMEWQILNINPDPEEMAADYS